MGSLPGASSHLRASLDAQSHTIKHPRKLDVLDAVGSVHLFTSPDSWVEGNALHQLEQVARLPGITAVAAMPDLHPGKFGPVGCGILADRIYPQFVGSDIGCGMSLFQLDVLVRKVRVDKLADRLGALDTPWDGDIEHARQTAELEPSAYDRSLGSIGGGNHFCELQGVDTIVDDAAAKTAGLSEDHAYVLVHSGSRGLGHHILQQYLPDISTTLEPDEPASTTYLAQHDHAVRWATLNRAIIVERAAKAAKADLRCINDLPHNFVDVLHVNRTTRFLHRKGAAASDRGLVPVPGSRGTRSYLMQPLADAGVEALRCLAHGAGRKYDRSSMHGRVKTKKSDLNRLKQNGFGGTVVCEDRQLLVEEAPDAYKNIEQVIDDLVQFGLARVVATFRPIVTFKTAINRVERSNERARQKSERRDKRKAGAR